MTRTAQLSLLAGSLLSVGVALGAEPDDSHRAYAAELKADADARTSELSSRGFSLDDEGESSVKLGGWSQFRYLMNWRRNPENLANGTHDSGFTNGFETARTRLLATGNVMVKDLTFKIEGEFNRGDGDFRLLDAWGRYKFENGVYTTWGQFKPPLLREELVSDIYQLGMGRSTVNEIFSLKRSQGVMIGYQNESWNLRASVNDGANALNTSYVSPVEADFAVTGRIEYKGAGDWKQLDDFTGWRAQSLVWLLGGAVHYQHNGNTASTGTPAQQADILYTVDATIEGSGWTAYGAFVGRNQNPDTDSDSFNDFGVLAQGGYMFTEKLDVFLRWDAVMADGDRTNTDNDWFNTLSLGSNYYLFPRSHAAKFTVELDWFVEQTQKNSLVNAFANSSSSDLIAIRPSDRDDQFALKFQFQLVF
jgi:hypothetical protein